jgi:hypothetical protein
MNRALTIFAAVTVGSLGHDVSAQPEVKQKETPVVKESAWTWGYFFTDKDAVNVKALFGERKCAINVYRVEKVVAVQGKPGVSPNAGSSLIRVESAARISVPGEAGPKLLFHGVPQHLEYTTSEQRADLTKRSRADLPPGKDTVTVIIPIRKNAQWWALPTDERMAFFQKQGDKIGHTAIGAMYAEQIYRKLYHTRYAVETTDHDFITYFEFEHKHTDTFKSLLTRLRDPQQNPEWNYVDREYEIWLTKTN